MNGSVGDAVRSPVTLQWAIEQSTGDVVDAGDVDRDKRPFVCSECTEELILKRGDLRKPHFAHKPNSTCNGGSTESLQHKRAKQILKETWSEWSLLSTCRRCGGDGSVCCVLSKVAAGTGASCLLERPYGNYRVDAMIEDSESGPKAALEVFYTHAVSDDKKRFFEKAGLPLFEVRAVDVINQYNESKRSVRAIEKYGHCGACKSHIKFESENQRRPASIYRMFPSTTTTATTTTTAPTRVVFSDERMSRRRDLIKDEIESTFLSSNAKSISPPPPQRASLVSFQALSMVLDHKTGYAVAKGRSEAGESVAVTVKGFKHFFYLSRQEPFRDFDDCAWTLSVIERGLKRVASGNSALVDSDEEEEEEQEEEEEEGPKRFGGGGRGEKKPRKAFGGCFTSPDPFYKSKMSAPRKVWLRSDDLPQDSDLFCSWSLLRGCKKTMFGKTPKCFRENVLIVYLERPRYANIVHRYLESDHFRKYYTERGSFTDHVFKTRKMLRTFEATIPTDQVFRTKYSLTMTCWWSLLKPEAAAAATASSSFCFEVQREEEKMVYCDRYFECDQSSVICDVKRTDNSPAVLLGWDIECAGKMMGKTGKCRFPVAEWNDFRMKLYCKEVLRLRPPSIANMPQSLIDSAKSKPYRRNNNNNNNNRNSSDDDDDDEEDAARTALFQCLAANGYSTSLSQTSSSESTAESEEEEEEESTCEESSEEEEEEEDEEEEEEEEGEEEDDDIEDDGSPSAMNEKERRAWSKHTKTWTFEDWRTWISWALGQQPMAVKREVANFYGYEKWTDLIPAKTDTDPATIIGCCLRRLGKDEDLRFAEMVAFVYLHPSSKPIPPSIANSKNKVWNFHKVQIRVFRSEAQMISAFLCYRREKSPDFEYTWNGKAYFDIPYLWDRMVYMQKHGSQTDKKYAFDTNFGLSKDPALVSHYFEKFTTSNQGGDKAERIVTAPLINHNDGYLVVTNSSYGEKYPSNTLDWVSMKTLVYSRESTALAVDELIERDLLNPELMEYWCKVKEIAKANGEDFIGASSSVGSPEDVLSSTTSEGGEGKKSLAEMALEVFNDFPQRKMQFDIEEGTKRWKEGGQAFKDFIDYCIVDSVLPVLHGGKLSLQLALAKTANVTPEEVFHRGVQMKVLSIIYSICKNEHKGKFMVPDWGNLYLHWPGIFQNAKAGFELAVTQSPRLQDQTYDREAFLRAKDKAEERLAIKEATAEMEEKIKSQIEDILGSVEFIDADDPRASSVKPPAAGSSSNNNNNGAKGSKKTLPATKRMTATVSITRQPTLSPQERASRQQRWKKATIKRLRAPIRRAQARIRNAFIKKRQKAKPKRATGAFVFDPAKRGLITTAVPTEDFAQLYPSIILSYSLCYSTFLTEESIDFYGFERWEYTVYPMGLDGRLQFGEVRKDQKLAEDFGFDCSQADLRVSTFYNESDPEETVMGTLVKKLTALRGAAKRRMADCEKACDLLGVVIAVEEEMQHHRTSSDSERVEEKKRAAYRNLAVVAEGKYLTAITEKQMPLKVILRMAEVDQSINNNEQDADKRLSNSSYGFTCGDPKKGRLPLLELGNTVTTMGKFQLGLAKSVSQKITSKAHSKIYRIKRKFLRKDPKDRGFEFKGEKFAKDKGIPFHVEYDPADVQNMSQTALLSRYPRFKKERVLANKRGPKHPLDCSLLLNDRYLQKGWVSSHQGAVLLLSQYKNDVFYGDSVSGDTAVVVKLEGIDSAVRTVRVDEFVPTLNGKWKAYAGRDGKEVFEPKDAYVWQDGNNGFTKIKKIIRHACKKPLVRVLTHTGVVDCTEDHSLLDPKGAKISPDKATVGAPLLHVDSSLCALDRADPRSLADISAKEAFSWGAFLADGSCGRYDCASGTKHSWAVNKKDRSHLERVAEGLPFKTKILDTLRSLDTLTSSKVYKLVPTGESVKAIVDEYRSLFYNEAREKKVPESILNSPLGTIRAFMDGFYAGDGSKAEQATQKNYRFDQKGKEVCTGLWLLAQKLGYTVSLNDRPSKPTAFRITCSEKNASGSSSYRKDPTVVKKNYPSPLPRVNGEEEEEPFYVYDFETENHHFGVGPGNLVVHNTDSVMLMLCEALFGSTDVERIRQAFDLGRYCAYFINSFEWQIMRIVLEKVSKGTLMEKKKSYKMRLVDEDSGEFKEFLEKGGNVKRDVLPFVKKTIAAHSDDVLHKIGQGFSVEQIRGSIVTDIAERMDRMYKGLVDYKDLACKKKVSRLTYKSASSVPTHAAAAMKMKRRGDTVVFGDYVTYAFMTPNLSKEETEYFHKLRSSRTTDRGKALRGVREVGAKTTTTTTTTTEAGGEKYKKVVPNRKLIGKAGKKADVKARDVAEDVAYLEANCIPLDLRFIYDHQIKKPLCTYFSHLLSPEADVPYVDPFYSSVSEAKSLKLAREKLQSRQKENTLRILFSNFERDLDLLWIAIFENAYEDFHPLPAAFSRMVKPTRRHRCSFCYKIEKVEIKKKATGTGPVELTTTPAINNNNNVTLPPFVCKECLERSEEIASSLRKDQAAWKFRKDALDQLCKGCTCLLDKPELDADRCKSSQCSVYQKKAEALHGFKSASEKEKQLASFMSW